MSGGGVNVAFGMDGTRICADKRSREVAAAPLAERAAREAFCELARVEVKAARALATIERKRSYLLSNFASVLAWARSVGYGPAQAHRLLALGRSLTAAPELEAKVRGGQVAAESAISVGRVLAEPALELGAPEKAAEREAWVERAEAVPPSPFRDAAERAVEEARQGAPTLPMRFLVTKAVKDGFHRARLLMSGGKRHPLTEGETFGLLTQFWLAANDPRLVPLPKRRRGVTGRGEATRHVPQSVKAIVERRSGGKCEICHERRAQEKVHLSVPHAKGGSREADNLADACRSCHVLLDGGVLVFAGFGSRGQPRFRMDASRLPGGGSGTQGEELVRERAPPYRSAGRGGCSHGNRAAG